MLILASYRFCSVSGCALRRDALFDFPRDYEDLTRICPIHAIDGSGPVSVCGVVEDSELRSLSGDRSVLGVLVRDDTGLLRAVWFNQSFMHARLMRGQRVMLSGTPKRRGLCWEMSHPRVINLGASEQPAQGQMLPVYALTEGLPQSRLRKIIRQVVQELADEMPEVLPESLLADRQLWPIGRRCAASTCRATARMSGRRDGGSCTRNYSHCNWPWHSAAGTCSARNARPHCPPRPRSMPGSAGCFPSS